ncbi:MAG TPA: carbohydrate ABC transporter permease [Anaerolineae bacterium]|nr:carbohydrate ABC transporter permease [Anaerolineae bacterium]
MKRKTSQTILLYLLLIPLSLIMLFPFFWMITTSLKPEVDMFATPPVWIPNPPTLENYANVIFEGDFHSYLLNSLIVATVSTILGLVIGAPAAFGFARMPYRFSGILFLIIIAIRMFPPVSLVIPYFMGMRAVELIDRVPALIIAYLPLELPLVIWLLEGFFREFPKELQEAGEMDGLNALGILVRIAIPVSLPAIGVAAMFAFLVAWNEFIFALSLTRTPNAATMPVGIAGYVTNFRTFWGPMTAAASIYTIPVLIVTLFAQRGIVRGLLGGAIKA